MNPDTQLLSSFKKEKSQQAVCSRHAGAMVVKDDVYTPKNRIERS